MTWSPRQVSSKALLVIPAVLVCIYAAAVLWYAHSRPDIGLRSAFDPLVRRFDGQSVPVADGPPATLEEGDEITRLGDRPIETWPQLLHALNDLRDVVPAEVADLRQAERAGLSFVHWNADQYIRVWFDRGGQAGHSLSCWCRVGRLPLEEFIPSVLWAFLKVGLFLVGAFVYWKRPDDTAARQFFVLCIVTFGAYMGGYHWSRIAAQPALILVFMLCGVLLPAVLLHFYTVFPRPKGVLQRRPAATLAAVYGPPLCFLAGMVVCFLRVRWLGQSGAPDEEVNRALSLFLVIILSYLGVAAAWYLASIGCLVHSYRTAADPTERNQVKLILWGSLAAFIPIAATLYLAVRHRNAFGAGAATWPMFAASACLTAAFLISFYRYRLMQLDQVISSGLVYFLVSSLAVAVYCGLVFLGTLVVGTQAGGLSPWQALSVSTTALVLMLVLDFARARVRKALDRRFYREKHQLDRTIRRMGQAIEQLVDGPTLARQLLQAAAETLAVSRGSVYLRDGEPPLYRLVDSVGGAPPLAELALGCPLVENLVTRSYVVAPRGSHVEPVQRQLRFLGGEVAYALAHEGRLLGMLVLGSKDVGTYGTDDLNLLAAFAQLSVVALKSAERHRTIEGLNRDLQAKVEKIAEQQRRIMALQSQLMRQAPPPPPAAPQAEVPPPAGGIIGSSPAVQHLLQLARKVAASPSAVLITGESGTGKELLARALHENSPRAAKAFVKVHCAALSPTLLESELFGHVKGAFTGAHKDKVGRFELADGGTLFLDEIGDITLEVQTKLLRVLQEMTFERVGSSEPVTVDVRVIAATHQDLEALIAAGRFRHDLFYRLNVISLHVPPLRDRREDIAELVLAFLRQNAQRANKAVSQVDDDVLALLKGYAWPGNVRQLENVIERAVVVAEGTSLTVHDLPPELVAAALDVAPQPNDWDDADLVSGSVGVRVEREERDRVERERLVRALASAKGNKAEAARALGLARSTLLSRLKKHGLN